MGKIKKVVFEGREADLDKEIEKLASYGVFGVHTPTWPAYITNVVNSIIAVIASTSVEKKQQADKTKEQDTEIKKMKIEIGKLTRALKRKKKPKAGKGGSRK